MCQLSAKNKIFPSLVSFLILMMASSSFALAPDQIYDQVKDSVVVIKTYNQRGDLVSQGSGVMLPSGKFVTNYHVVKKGAQYSLGQGNNFVPAILELMDQEKDICILSAPGLNSKPAILGKSIRLKVGERVYAIGAPQGLELSLSEGIVSQLRGNPPPIIQTTAAISPGSSGGGLFNGEGELVGITTIQLKESQNLNFALPVEWITQVMVKAKNILPPIKMPEPRAIIPQPIPEGDTTKNARSLIEKEIKYFINDYLITLERNDLAGILYFYNDKVNYFNKGIVSINFIEKDKLDYIKRWPKRKYEVIGNIKIESISDQIKSASFRINFMVQNSRNIIEGIADNQLQLVKIGNQIKIVGEKQQVIRRDKF